MIWLFLFLIGFWFQVCPASALTTIPKKPFGWDEWTFDEKVAWRGKHLDPRIPYASYVDKVGVKQIVGNDILTAKTLHVTDNLKQIFAWQPPQKYLMKANNASGRGLLVVDEMILARMKRDRNFVPVPATQALLFSYAKQWLSTPYQSNAELQYGLIHPRILFEEYLEHITMDIELFCFNGEVELIEVLFIDSYKNDPVISFYDRNWNLLETTHPTHTVRKTPINRPHWLDKLFVFVKHYTQNIDQVRVDFYLNGEYIYFGEFTFTTGAGVVPSFFQRRLGQCWKYPEVN
jgi:hypothetical protein